MFQLLSALKSEAIKLRSIFVIIDGFDEMMNGYEAALTEIERRIDDELAPSAPMKALNELKSFFGRFSNKSTEQQQQQRQQEAKKFDRTPIFIPSPDNTFEQIKMKTKLIEQQQTQK